MATAPTSPGVHIHEVPSGAKTIVAASSSIGMAIGETKSGPLFEPVRITNFSDYKRTFSDDSSVSDMFHYMKLFFMNGGSDCYVMRIAHGAQSASVTLQTEDNAPSLTLVAKSAGQGGESIRAIVKYSGPRHETAFDIELFQWGGGSSGNSTTEKKEIFRNLSMDPTSSNYAPTFLTQNSKLVDATDAAAAAGNTAIDGFAMSGRPIPYKDLPTLGAAFTKILETDGNNHFQISVDGGAFVHVDLSGIDIAALVAAAADIGAFKTSLQTSIAQAIDTAHGVTPVVTTVTLEDGPVPTGVSVGSFLLKIASDAQGDILVQPSQEGHDLAIPLMLGSSQGGLEVSAHAYLRPAPNGLSYSPTGLNAGDLTHTPFTDLMERRKDHLIGVYLEQTQDDGSTAPVLIETPVGADEIDTHLLYVDVVANSPNGNNDGIRQKLLQIAAAIDTHKRSNPQNFFWEADVSGARITFRRTSGGPETDNLIGTVTTEPAAQNLTGFTTNVRHSTVGSGGNSLGLQVSAPGGISSDGDTPTATDYDTAYEIIDRDVRMFNLMVLPPSRPNPQDMQPLLGAASAFCLAQRAMLIVDPPPGTQGAQTMATDVNALRTGLVTTNSVLHYPQITIDNNGLDIDIGPAGAMAGLYARTDNDYGPWKAAAGIEATLYGVRGVDQNFTDAESGIMNPRGINAIRVFPGGITSWGGRTLDGDDDFASEWKYTQIRRTALLIEESMYRGLKWAVFKNNDHILWGQIRNAADAFMKRLFVQGAFKGKSKDEAYFVKCDEETTPQSEADLGIVNVSIGFAPQKPAEFVIVHLQQLAGQTES